MSRPKGATAPSLRIGLPELFAEAKFEQVLILTYGADLEFYERVLRRHFGGYRNQIVLGDGRLLGSDVKEPSWHVRIADQTTTRVDVAYSLFAANQSPACCDPTGEKVIGFVYDGTGVTPQNGPFPTTDQALDDHR